LLWLEQMNSGCRNKRIFLIFFSKFKIYNCIIVSQEYSVIHNECKGPKNVNVLDTNMKLAVYTSFPYQSSERFTEVNDINQLKSWVISAQGTSPRILTCFHERSVTASTDVLWKQLQGMLYGILLRSMLTARIQTLYSIEPGKSGKGNYYCFLLIA